MATQWTMAGAQAVQAGNRVQARQYLARALSENAADEQAWLLLSLCVDDPQQKRDCLQRALALNPQNSRARQALAELEPGVRGPVEPHQQVAMVSSPRSPLPAEEKTEKPSSPAPLQHPPARPRRASPAPSNVLSFRRYTWIHFWLTALLLVLTGGILYALQPTGMMPVLDQRDSPDWLASAPSSKTYELLNPLAAMYPAPGGNPSQATISQPVVVLSGELLDGSVFERDGAGQPLAFALDLQTGEQTVVVLYRGYIGHVRPGDLLKVEGILPVAGSSGMIAYRLERLSPALRAPQTTAFIFWRAVVALSLWALLGISVYLWGQACRRIALSRRPRSTMLAILLPGFLLAGCHIDFTTVLQEEGEGTIQMQIEESKENLDFLRKVPGMAGYLDTSLHRLRAAGLQLDSYSQGDQEVIFLQRSDVVLSQEAQPLAGDEGSWVAVQRYQQDGYLVLRYQAMLDTTQLYQFSNEVDPAAMGAIRDQLNQIQFSYRVVMPGAVRYHNGGTLAGGGLRWEIPMNQRTPVIVESWLPPAGAGPGRLAWYGVAGGFVFFTIVLAVGLVLPNRRKTA